MRQIKMLELCEAGGWPGHPFRGRIVEADDGDGLVVQLRDVDAQTGIAWDCVKKVRFDNKKAPRWLEEGDILFTARGIRFNAVCARDIPGPAVCSPHFFHLRIDKTLAIPEFVSWQINQVPFQNQLSKLTEGSESATLRMPVFEQMSLALPSLQEQKKLMQLIVVEQKERRVLEQLIENNERQMKIIAFSLMNQSSERQ
ncbi:MAG: restriction endonuclease subunit S [Pseudomonadales bacterium]|nr:restriction endonuclease subunit S [Pseudomonadales bacterium]